MAIVEVVVLAEGVLAGEFLGNEENSAEMWAEAALVVGATMVATREAPLGEAALEKVVREAATKVGDTQADWEKGAARLAVGLEVVYEERVDSEETAATTVVGLPVGIPGKVEPVAQAVA